MTERWTPEMLDQFASRINATLDRMTERMDARDAAFAERMEATDAAHNERMAQIEASNAAHDERMAQIEMNIAAVTQQQVVSGQMLQELHVIVGDLANGLTGIQTEVRRLIERNGGQ
jgi:hypothetical protein